VGETTAAVRAGGRGKSLGWELGLLKKNNSEHHELKTDKHLEYRNIEIKVCFTFYITQ